MTKKVNVVNKKLTTNFADMQERKDEKQNSNIKKRGKVMNAFMKALGLSLLGLIISPSVWAVGTTAGTDITNTATATYDVGGTPLTLSSNTTTTTVAELLNVIVIGQDVGSQVTVGLGDSQQILTYQVSNTGNGTDSYSLTVANLTTSGDDFDSLNTKVYRDSNGNGVYDDSTSATPDVELDGSNDPSLIADQSITVFVVGDIPSTGLVDGNTADLELTVISNTGTGPAGTVITTPGFPDAVIGSSEGSGTAIETYVLSNTVVTLNKAANVIDTGDGFGTSPVPGATIRYSIEVVVTGAVTATGVVISDPIPTNTTYVSSSMKLDPGTGTFGPLTDGEDSADVGGDGATTNAAAVTVNLGDLKTGTQIITFDVTIN